MREQLDPGAPADALATATRWGLARRLAFRFVVLHIPIHFFPFPLYESCAEDRQRDVAVQKLGFGRERQRHRC